MTIDRRQFVQRSSWAVGLGLLPDWLARGLAQGQDPARAGKPTRADELRAARLRAVKRGKPLVVFVVPEDERQVHSRGYQFGALIHHGGDRVLLDLAMCEPACATAAEVRAELGGAKIECEPMLLVAEPLRSADGAAASWDVTAISLEPGSDPSPMRMEERRLRERTARLAEDLHDAVARDRGWLAKRADSERATLTESEHRALDRLLASSGETPDDGLVVRAAAVVQMAAEAPRRPGDRDRLRKRLLEAARRTFVERRIPGSRWAVAGGCGITVEGGKAPGIAGPCGTGFVPAMCRRFLYLFVE